jgi:hypothetical protein
MSSIIPGLFDPKLVTESDEFSYDFVNNLANSETLSSASVTATPSGLTIGSAVITRSVVTAFISGGVAGTSYTLTFEVNTSAGRTIGFEAILNVVA